MGKISLMMVTYNRLDLTKVTIENIKRSVGDLKYNFIIVDNNSTDGTVEFLKTLGEGYHIVYNNDNLGIGRGRNQTLLEADKLGTDWYVTLDNDIDLPDGWLEEAINILKANRNYGAIGVNMEDKPYPIVELNGTRFQNKPHGNLGTAAMVFRKELHRAIGFFKEYNKYGLEDADYGVRARVMGFGLGYIERMGTHLGTGSNDTGDYRTWKTDQHDSRLDEFKRNVGLYYQGSLPIYIGFKG